MSFWEPHKQNITTEIKKIKRSFYCLVLKAVTQRPRKM